jgi:hypothetical protein
MAIAYQSVGRSLNMAQTLVTFDTPVVRDGRSFRVQACGRERDNGQWEAWLEFEDTATGEVLRSQRETTQPNLKDTVYWATGLTPVYLEGALDRILNPTVPRPIEVVPSPRFDGPAPHPRVRTPVTNREPVLDPFSVYEKSPELLAQELTALRGWHLRQIIRDYDLVDERDVHLEEMTEPELGSLIVQRVRALHP